MDKADPQYHYGTIIVSFQDREMRRRFIEKFKIYSPRDSFETFNGFIALITRDYCRSKKNKVTLDNFKVKRAPHPEELRWGNIGPTSTKTLIWYIMNFVVIIICTLISFGCAALIKIDQKKLQPTDVFKYRFLSAITAGVVVIMNFTIQFLIPYITDYQKDMFNGSRVKSSAGKIIFVV